MRLKLVIIFLFFTVFTGTYGMEKKNAHPDPRPTSYSFTEYVKGGIRSLFKTDDNPTWSGALTKVSAGIAGLYLFNNLSETNSVEHYTYSSLGFMSAALTFNGIYELAYLSYDYLRYPSMARQAFGRSMRETPHGRDRLNQLILRSDLQLTALTRAGRLSLNTLCTLYSTYHYLSQLIGMLTKGTNPFGLSYPDGIVCTSNFLCMPIMIPTFLALFTSTVIYNIRELSHFSEPTFGARGDVPFFELVNGFVRVGLSAQIPKAYKIDLRTLQVLSSPQLYDFSVTSAAHQHLTSAELYDLFVEQHNFHLTDRMIYLLAKEHANFLIYSSLILVVKNMGDYIWGRVRIGKQKKGTVGLDSLPNLKPREGRKGPIRNLSALQAPPQTSATPLSSTLALMPPLSNPTDSLATHQPPSQSSQGLLGSSQPHERTKTRGTPDISKAQRLPKPPRAKGPSSEGLTKEDPTLPIRQAALERLRQLRRQYPIKEDIILSEIRQAERFLQGESRAVGKNKYELIWSIGDNEYNVHYEIPHGNDGGVYAGNRLDNVLTSLEMCYIVGLDEMKAKEYIESYNLYHLLRIDRLMYYIFFNRNRL